MPDIRRCIPNNTLQQINVPNRMTLNNILQHNTAINILQILIDRCIIIRQMRQKRHSAMKQIRLPTFRSGPIRICQTKFPKRKRIYRKRNIPPGKQCRQFAGQQMGIRSRNIDIRPMTHSQGIDNPFPSLDFLNLIEKQNSCLFTVQFLHNVFIQSRRLTKRQIAHILKVIIKHRRRVIPLFPQCLLNLL